MQYSFSMEQNQPDIGLLLPEGRNDSIRLTCSTSSALLTGMVGTAGAGGSVTWLVALAAGLFTGFSRLSSSSSSLEDHAAGRLRL